LANSQPTATVQAIIGSAPSASQAGNLPDDLAKTIATARALLKDTVTLSQMEQIERALAATAPQVVTNDGYFKLWVSPEKRPTGQGSLTSATTSLRANAKVYDIDMGVNHP
jgi:hypothetical protein